MFGSVFDDVFVSRCWPTNAAAPREHAVDKWFVSFFDVGAAADALDLCVVVGW